MFRLTYSYCTGYQLLSTVGAGRRGNASSLLTSAERAAGGKPHRLRRSRLSNGFSVDILTFMPNVKKPRRRASKISSKHQITIPVEALRNAGLEVGDRVIAHADGAGRVILEREHDVVNELAGALTGVYKRDELDALRSEWH